MIDDDDDDDDDDDKLLRVNSVISAERERSFLAARKLKT